MSSLGRQFSERVLKRYMDEDELYAFKTRYDSNLKAKGFRGTSLQPSAQDRQIVEMCKNYPIGEVAKIKGITKQKAEYIVGRVLRYDYLNTK